MNIPTNRNRSIDPLHITLIDQNLPRLLAQYLDLVFAEVLAAEEAGYLGVEVGTGGCGEGGGVIVIHEAGHLGGEGRFEGGVG